MRLSKWGSNRGEQKAGRDSPCNEDKVKQGRERDEEKGNLGRECPAGGHGYQRAMVPLAPRRNARVRPEWPPRGPT